MFSLHHFTIHEDLKLPYKQLKLYEHQCDVTLIIYDVIYQYALLHLTFN